MNGKPKSINATPNLACFLLLPFSWAFAPTARVFKNQMMDRKFQKIQMQKPVYRATQIALLNHLVVSRLYVSISHAIDPKING